MGVGGLRVPGGAKFNLTGAARACQGMAGATDRWRFRIMTKTPGTPREDPMQSEADTPAGSNGAPKGLPPVAPPSGRFIAQLFLIPALVATVAVFIVLGPSCLLRSSQNPDTLLANLDSPNPEVR